MIHQKLTFAGLDLNNKAGCYPSASRHLSEELLIILARYFNDIPQNWIIVAKQDYLCWPLLWKVQFPERNGKKSTVSQITYEKGDLDISTPNPNPIYFNAGIYDHFVEIKIPSYSQITYEYDTQVNAATAAQTTLLLGLFKLTTRGLKSTALSLAPTPPTPW